MFYVSTHYREPIDLDENAIKQAKEKLNAFYNIIERINNSMKDEKINDEKLEKVIGETRDKFSNAMNDDFNTPLALSVLFELAKEANKFIDENGKISKKTGEEVIKTFKKLGYIFGILQKEIKKEKLSKEILDLIVKREGYRKRGDFQTADKIRKELSEKGILVEDSPEGPRWKKIK